MTAKLYGPINSGVAAGGAGVATANATTPHRLRGEVMGVYVRYNDAPPAGTTDIVIKANGDTAPTFNLLAIPNAATDGWFYPRAQIHTVAGALIAGEYTPLVVDDTINVKIDQANNGDSIDVWLMLRED